MPNSRDEEKRVETTFEKKQSDTGGGEIREEIANDKPQIYTDSSGTCAEIPDEMSQGGTDSEEISAEIGDEDAGKRIDIYLAERIDAFTRSYVQKLIDSGNVSAAGRKKLSKNYKLRKGDVINIIVGPPQKLDVTAEKIQLDIVYEDDSLLVVNKPKGMVVHPAAGNYSGTLVNALMYHCGSKLSSINGVVRPGIVHRIDKDTSGLLVVAKTDKAHSGLSDQLKDHSMTRYYTAVVYNNFREPEGTIDAPISRDKKNRLRMAVAPAGEGRRAVTHYRVLEHAGGFSLIECKLETGRTHQIRVHMAHINHPLLGDFVYGPKKNKYGAGSQMLHAGVLGFIHPVTGEYLEFKCEPPDEFKKVCGKIFSGYAL